MRTTLLLASCLRAVSLVDLKMSGVYDVKCTDLGNSHECLFDQHIPGALIPESRIVGAFDQTIDLSKRKPSEWCQFANPPHHIASGFMLSTYVGEHGIEGHTVDDAVYGDRFGLTQDEPSYGVLILGSDVEGNWTENCGHIVRLRKAGNNHRYLYVVIAAGVRAKQAHIGPNEIGLKVSPRVMSTACCDNNDCLVENGGDMIPKRSYCFEDMNTEFEIEVLSQGDDPNFGQTNQVLGTQTLPDYNAKDCPDFVLEDGQLIAQAVQLDGTFGGFVSNIPTGTSAEAECGKSFEVLNEKDRQKTIVVTIASFMNLADESAVDGAISMRIQPDDCEKLCPGQCHGGRLGAPPPHCHLTFVEEVLETTTVAPEATTDSSTEGAPTAPEGMSLVDVRAWQQLSTCGAFSCLSGKNLPIPTECGSKEQPCYASMAGAEDRSTDATSCGALYELQNDEGLSLFMQIIDFDPMLANNRVDVSPYGLPIICRRACKSPSVSSFVQCREECVGTEVEVERYCDCVSCFGAGGDSGNLESACRKEDVCQDCHGDCVSLPGQSAVEVPVSLYARFDILINLPATSSAVAPACAAAAFSFLS